MASEMTGVAATAEIDVIARHRRDRKARPELLTSEPGDREKIKLGCTGNPEGPLNAKMALIDETYANWDDWDRLGE